MTGISLAALTTILTPNRMASSGGCDRRSGFLAMREAIELFIDRLGSAFAREVLRVRRSEPVSEEFMKLRSNRSTKSESKGIQATKKSFAPVRMKHKKWRFKSPLQLHLPTLGVRSCSTNLVHEEMTDAANPGTDVKPHNAPDCRNPFWLQEKTNTICIACT
jgi:hypothetical protein